MKAPNVPQPKAQTFFDALIPSGMVKEIISGGSPPKHKYIAIHEMVV